MENPKVDKHHHHILPNSTVFVIGGALMVLTVVTVAVAQVDLGRLNFPIAMLVASVKASLVALFFMNLKYDKRENGVIFATSFLFLAIFFVLTGTDLFFRGNVYSVEPISKVVMGSKLKDPWNPTPELVAHGKEQFQIQCVSCHGAAGKGDGAAAGALNPKPRNFTAAEGWKNGRKPSQIFKTLKEGIAGGAMASFATLPSDDRWALVHYVRSLGPDAELDTNDDLKKVGIDPTKQGGGETVAPEIPVEIAMERMAVAEDAHHANEGARLSLRGGDSVGGRLYQTNCASCHGAGLGGDRVKRIGGAHLTVRPLNDQLESVRSFEAFSHVVIRGIPGDIMPGFGQLSGAELRELHSFVRTLQSR